jgi:uncharacterized protein YjbJ (UPF0337 family)
MASDSGSTQSDFVPGGHSLFEGVITMNWDQIQGNWKQMTGQIKEKWGKLTDDDLTTIAGKRDQLAGLLQQKYGYAKELAETELDKFTHGLRATGLAVERGTISESKG